MPSWYRRWRTGLLTGVSTGALVLSSLAFAPGAAADGPVSQGIGQQVVQSATVFGNTPADTPVQVSIILRARDAVALTQYINQASQDHHFLTTAQFAEQFGQSSDVIHGIQAYLARYGIQTTVYADNLDITAQGTAGEFDQAFSVSLKDMSYHGEHFRGTKDSPMVPRAFESPILAVLGLSNYQGMFATHAVKAQFSPKLVGQPSAGSSGVGVGLSATYAAQHYNATPLYAAGDTGQGNTVGIVTLASLNPSDAFTYWKGVGASTNPSRLQLVNVDGGAGAPSLNTGSDETALDVEQSGTLAPQANVIVYQAPNTDYGYADAFYQAVSANQADALSTSWGESETYLNYFVQQGEESAAYAQAFNQVLMEAAAQGISTFAASGDAGAYDAARDLGTTNLSVDNPGSDPYITAAGGTTLAGTQNYGVASINIAQERTWAWDYFWPYWQQFGYPNQISWALRLFGGSGGGYSSIFPTPTYQMAFPGVHRFDAVQYLTPIQQDTNWAFNFSPQVSQGTGLGRAVPDLAMNADPQTGYGVYSTLFEASYGSDWAQYGGTSFVAPQLAGLTAVIDQYAGGRVGFWNPQIYRFAKQKSSPFTPLDASGTSNDNLYYTGRPGALYNPGSGLGIPDIYALAQDFAAAGTGRYGAERGAGPHHQWQLGR